MKESMKKKRKKILLALLLAFFVAACGSTSENERQEEEMKSTSEDQSISEEIEIEGSKQEQNEVSGIGDDFQLIPGGTFLMGSPETEGWRSEDEIQHLVTVSDFYMASHEVTQAEYESVMGENPSTFSGADLPVENLTWLEAVAYCNARSEAEGLTSVYEINGQEVSWNRGAQGYRLPTEAEWEYACRGGTETPFNTETSISPEECNYWGHYPYLIEENYFNQSNLETRPGIYRETTISVESFASNAFGLYDMHGNVGEWVWDYYTEYDTAQTENPAGPVSGTRRVYRGGGWNDFAKNLRSAYRAAMPQENTSAAVGLRLVRNAIAGEENMLITSGEEQQNTNGSGNILIAYFSWGGNTRGIAEEIQSQTGADIFEIAPETPYSSNYNTVLEEAQRDQNEQARSTLINHVEDMSQYDTIILGYPNWWASIPMPVATFLEEYDFSGKTILPFCSHGGGRFGQSLTAIAKLVPDAEIKEGLAISYSGGNSMPQDVADWLDETK